MNETRRFARLSERKLAALEALKKSLLHQAFTWNLSFLPATHQCHPCHLLSDDAFQIEDSRGWNG